MVYLNFTKLLPAHRRVVACLYQHARYATGAWTSSTIRKTFIEHFNNHGYTSVPSSSVIPKQDEGSYFINAGMNQFKPLFLGSIDPAHDWCRMHGAVNSQKCIRVGGKHNDLDDVGQDGYHHTFFEMLGFWTFQQTETMKHDACERAWQLLTEVYRLPKDNLYVTYFGGDGEKGLQADLQTRDIWLKLGLPYDRILPFGIKDNFWEMGDTGPCGPCTEIHYCYLPHDRGNSHVSHATLVNADSPDLIELWNIVFMQYNRLHNGELSDLPSQFVDTGMGLERLTAVLQGQRSNYNTDLFTPALHAIQEFGVTRKYTDLYGSADADGIDAAYRIIVDHCRALCVAIADGIMPGTYALDMKVRQLSLRTLRQSHRNLRAERRGLMAALVPHVIQPLCGAFPELDHKISKIQRVLEAEEERYMSHVAAAAKQLNRLLASSPSPSITHLTGEDLFSLHTGQQGLPVPIDYIHDLIEEYHLTADWEQFNSLMQQINTSDTDVAMPGVIDKLAAVHEAVDVSRILPTIDDYKYTYTRQHDGYTFDTKNGHAQLMFVDTQPVDTLSNTSHQDVMCHLVLNDTCFYAHGGGQQCDVGEICNKNFSMRVTDVHKHKNHVIHSGYVTRGDLQIGEQVTCHINQSCRISHMRNHTATHILAHALDLQLGNVQQRGSSVKQHQLTFDFTCDQLDISASDLEAVSRTATDMIEQSHKVHRTTVDYTEAKQLSQLRMLDEVYPSRVHVISIGQTYNQLKTSKKQQHGCAELCGGTHVQNTADIGAIVITNLTGVRQGTKRLTAVTGDAARLVLQNAEYGNQLMAQLSEDVKRGVNRDTWTHQEHQIQRLLAKDELPKLVRDKLNATLESLQSQLTEQRGQTKRQDLTQNFEDELSSQSKEGFVVSQMQAQQNREVLDVLLKIFPKVPVLVTFTTTSKKGGTICSAVCYVPEVADNADTDMLDSWCSYIFSRVPGTSKEPNDKKKVKKLPGRVSVLRFIDSGEETTECVLEAAKDYMKNTPR